MPEGLQIRALEPEDVSAVADHYERIFRNGNSPAPAGLVSAMRGLFLDSPTWAKDIPPLVIVTNDGIGGFQGIQVRRFRFEGKCGRYASFGPLFVVPELRARAAGITLMKAALAGPQDLSISDGASNEARWLWEQAGGRLASTQSLEWTIPIEPFGYALARLDRRYRGAYRKALGAVRPIAALADKTVRRRWLRKFPRSTQHQTETRPLTVERWCEIGDAIAADYLFQVLLDPPMAQWIMNQLEHFTCRGIPVCREALKGGRSLGCYIGYLSKDRVFSLMQFQASVRNTPLLLAALIAEARANRWLAVTGRLDGAIPAALGDYPTFFTNGTRVLLHGPGRAMLNAIAGLDVSMGRTDGEWLMNLREQDYA